MNYNYKDEIGTVTISENISKATLEYHIELRDKMYFALSNILENEKKLTKNQLERLATCFYYLQSYNASTQGRLQEILSVKDNSKKLDVSKQGKNDFTIRYRKENGRIVNKAVERKINGGRIQNSIDKLNNGKDELFCYSMSICNASTSHRERVIEPIICRFSTFYNVLLECNAIKETKGDRNELAIQASSKQLYLRLLDYPIVYNKFSIYSDDDFDGIEI